MDCCSGFKCISAERTRNGLNAHKHTRLTDTLERMADDLYASAAPGRSVLLSLLVDGCLAVLAALTTLLLAPVAAWLWAIIVFVIGVLALTVWRGVWGSSVGHTVLGVRTIDAASGLPSFHFLTRRAFVIRGSALDPFALQPVPIAHAQVVPAERVEEPHPILWLHVDDGTSHTVAHAALVGRDPVEAPDDRHTLIAIPDLTRTVSKSHFLADVTEGGVVVTDLGSANGTWVQGEEAALAPNKPTLVEWGSTLRLGDRMVLLDRRTLEAL